MSDADKPANRLDLPALMDVTRRLENARTTDPDMKDARIGELLRLVPGKRAIVEGQFQGRAAVFRLCLDPASDTSAREWAEMQRLWPLMQTDDFRIARPMHFSPQNKLIVVEKASGTPLLTYLKACDEPERSKHWPKIATWLRHATESTETWRNEHHTGWLKRAERAASAQPFSELRSVETAILAQIDRIGTLFQGSDWRVAICHGDYHPNNLITDGARLTAIDTGGSAKLPVYKDMARFLVHMARRDNFLSDERSFGVDRQGIRAFAQAFDFTDTEERMILPFMIGVEALLRVENASLSPVRISQALAMSEALLEDLRLALRL